MKIFCCFSSNLNKNYTKYEKTPLIFTRCTFFYFFIRIIKVAVYVLAYNFVKI